MILGLIFWVGAFIYVLISIYVIHVGFGIAEERGYPGHKGGRIAALIMLLIPFWDWFPTIAIHKFYCMYDGGLEQHMSVEKWRRRYDISDIKSTPLKFSSRGQKRSYLINSKVRGSSTSEEVLFGIKRRISEIATIDTRETIATFVYYHSDQNLNSPKELRDVKFWMRKRNCGYGDEMAIFSNIRKELREASNIK